MTKTVKVSIYPPQDLLDEITKNKPPCVGLSTHIVAALYEWNAKKKKGRKNGQ